MRTQADVQRDADRLLKVQRAVSIKIHGRDQHGDTIFVDIEGVSAQQIMEYIHKGLAQPNNFMEKIR
jgi:peptide deformylase